MITETLIVSVTCDTCQEPLATGTSRQAARDALTTATGNGWTAGPGGQAACPTCTARATCALHGHVYSDQADEWPWRLCGCDQDIPSHADQPGSPFEPGACGMEWRVCRRCDHIDEHHVTDPPSDTDDPLDDLEGDGAEGGVGPGGHLRQDVPAGPALPTTTSTHPTTSTHMASRENAMVEQPAQGWSA